MSSRLRALLAEMADLEKAATPGPWEAEGVGGIHMDGTRDGYVICSVNERRIASLHPATTSRLAKAMDAALIVALRNNWDKYERILKAAVEYVEAHEDWHTNKNYSKEAFLRMKASRAALVAAVTEAQ